MDLNFLNETLDSEESHLPNISSTISELINHTKSLKSDVKAVVENSSIHFTPLLRENEQLKLKSDTLLKEMMAVEEEIDGEVRNKLSDCMEELGCLSSSLREVKLFLDILKKLLEINTLVKEARDKLKKNEFLQCAQLVTRVQGLVKADSEDLKQVDIFRTLSREVVLTYEQLIHQISEIWSECISISVADEFEKNVTEIKIAVDVEFSSDLDQILKASDVLKSNLIERKFSQFLLNDILKKVILKKSKVSSRVDNKAILLTEVSSDGKPNYLEVFDNIQKIIEFLKLHLDIQIQDGCSFLSKVGSQIAEEFADCLIKNCLSETIPTKSDDLDKYKVVVENAQEFEKTLQESGFLPRDSSSLLDYAKNINVLFANKFCQSYLYKARLIMKKDLHNVTVCENVVSDVSVLPVNQRNVLKEKLNIKEDLFSFPKCQISASAEELMTLIHSMMNEIEKSLDLCAVRLFFTVRNIFEMYSAIVPLHHKRFLETLPHQVALFHNNCMYFAHQLIKLTTERHKKMADILKDHLAILLEEAVVLRSLAAETLEVTVTNQRNQLVYILRDSGFATLNENPKLDPNSEKIIRQCVRQMQILQTVWKDVLPANVYSRAMGFLLDAIIDELINLIISVEDISSQTASELVSCFTVVLDKSPSLFLDSKEIYRHSRKWQKFNEFVLILNGSLRDIDDRWASGMGPLAAEFTAEQVKHLIRALFQNSERRAAVLLKIR